MKHEQQTFLEHLQELGKRLILPSILLAIGMLIGFIWYKPFAHLLTKPLGETLYFTSPIGGLNFVMFIGLVLGLALALPVLIYQIVKFISPVHEKITTRSAVLIMIASITMAALGVWYAYAVSLPNALKFLMGIGGSDIQPIITTNEYISFLSAYLLGCAAIFQLPIILFFIDHIRPIPPGALRRFQKPVIAICFIVGAMITPTPDPMNQMVVTLPMLALFEVSVLLIYLRRRHRTRRHKASEPAVVSPPVQAHHPVLATSPSSDSHDFMPKPTLPTQSAPVKGLTRSELSSPHARTAQSHVIDLSKAQVTYIKRRGPKRRYSLPTATRPILDIRHSGTA